MRSIFVSLILVMIGLNGKGQSVTALPDSVLSQCCLEVTLLNGNVTTVDWVFVQYITRDGTGTKLFVEYAPNFGGIQWETQIRIQDDFDDVLERSKFIVIPFTVGSTDYGINRNWIANIEENTTTGGTWIYGRFGTPTKRKFSAVEDYETMKNLLLACRPRAIVVAENGLYTEGDTVRMGGFLIEPTTITTEGYNWMMKDTLSKTEFGIDYLTAETGDTTVYWGRRSGSVRQMMQMGNRYWYNTMKDTVGGLFSDLTHSWSSGNPFLKYLIFNPLAPNSGTAWMQIQRDNSFLLVSNETTNPFYTLGWTVTSTVAQLGANESGSGDPGNGVVMGAYGFGTTEFLFMKTKAVDAGTATNGQYLQLIDNSSGEVDFATIDLSAYLTISDTAAMLLNYPSTAGYGIIDAGKTWRADTTSPNGLATRLFAKTLPTSIVNGRIAVSNGSNLVGYANFNYTDTRPTLSLGAGLVGASTTPTLFDLGNTVSSAAGANPKIRLYSSGGNVGFGISTAQVDYLAQAGFAHGFYLGSTRYVQITSSALRMQSNATLKFDYTVGSQTTPMIDMFGGTYGMSITTASMNYFVGNGAKHDFLVNGALASRITSNSNILIGTSTEIPTSILTARSTTKSSSPFPLHTLAQSDAITGVQGNFDYETTQNGLRWYNGTRKAYALESTFARGTSGYFPRFDANGQIIDSEARVSSTNMIVALTGGLQIPSGTSAQQSSTGAGHLRWNTSLGYPTIFNGASTQSVLIGPFTGFASGEMMYGAASGGMPTSNANFKWDITNSRLLIGLASYGFASTTKLVVQQSTANAFIADFRQTSSTAFAPLAIMKLTRTDNTVGYGSTFAFYFNNSASAEVDYARFGSLIENNTSGSHSGALAFYTTQSAATTQERMRISSIGRVGINTTNATHRLHVNGRARIDTTDATPTSIIGLDGNNVIGKLTLGTGLSITSGTLNATGGTVTSVGLSLPSVFSVSGSPVTSSGTLTGTFTASTTSHVLRGDGDWANSLDYFKINQSLASVERFEVNGNLVLARDNEAHKLMFSRGWLQEIWGGGVTGDMTFRNGSGAGFQNYFILGTSSTADTVITMHGYGLGVYTGKANKLLARLHVKGLGTGSNKTMLLEDSGGADILTVTDNKLIQAHRYGDGSTEAGDIGLPTPTHLAAWVPSGAGKGTLVDFGIGTGLAISGGLLTATASAPTQILAESYNRITSTSSPQTFSSTISDNIVDQGGTQASFTFDFPASPVDGQVLTVTWNNAISVVTLNGNGNTIVGTAVTTAVAGSQRKFKYCGTCTTPAWIKIY